VVDLEKILLRVHSKAKELGRRRELGTTTVDLPARERVAVPVVIAVVIAAVVVVVVVASAAARAIRAIWCEFILQAEPGWEFVQQTSWVQSPMKRKSIHAVSAISQLQKLFRLWNFPKAMLIT
jgi:hypothetical protein